MKEREPGPILQQVYQIYRELLIMEERWLTAILNDTPLNTLACACPACFGPRDGETGNGHSLLASIDGNFSQSRYESAAKYDFPHVVPPIFIDEKYIKAAKAAVEETENLKAAPDEFCSDSSKAKDDGQSDGAYSGKHDSGLMALVCWHDAALKVHNLVKSGEKLYFAVAFIMFLLEVDPTCSIGALYDVGCNFWVLILKRHLFEEEIRGGRLTVALAVFHTYTHNWLCQMAFNPRFKTGFGLSDGEGTAIFWSYLSKIIALNLTSNSLHCLLNVTFERKSIMRFIYLDWVGFFFLSLTF